MSFEIVATRDGETKRKTFDSRSEAESKADDLRDLFDTVDVQQADTPDEPTTGPGTACEECGGELPADAPEDATLCRHHGPWALASSGGEPTTESESMADKMETPPEATQADVSESVQETVPTTQNGHGTPETHATGETHDLPDKPPVDTDPLDWVPADFVDTIQGKPAINRKGYEVMAAHYGIGTTSDVVVGPEETDFVYCRVKATATTSEGVTYQAHGSAHVDRGDDGDDKEILLEMADTRARKRAIAQATGVGMIAVSEIQNTP